MWTPESQAALDAIDAAQDEDAAFAAMTTYAHALGAEMISYYNLAPSYARHRESFTLKTSGFPDHWIQNYRTRNYRRIDPIAAFASYQTRPILWSSVAEIIDLSSDQAEFLETLWAWLAPGDGMAIPLFGPSGRHGSVGLARRQPLDHWEPSKIRAVRAVCAHFHLRFCELRLSGQAMDFELTAREQAVLHAMARGLPDPMICGVVNAQLDSVRATIESILTKMNVIDRPSALLRAKGLNLID